MESLNTYPRYIVDRRTNLVLDDVEQIRNELISNYGIDSESNLIAMLNNIEIALDFKSNESDVWSFYNNGSRNHLNYPTLNN